MSIYSTILDLFRAVSVDDGGTDEIRTTVTSSALPSGASTEAKQDTGNASLSSIDTKSTRAFATSSNTRPVVTITSSTILASNANRKYAIIFNQSGATIYLKLGSTAVVNEGIRVVNNGMYEITSDNLFTGDINAIRGAGSGAIEVFEGTI